jgi:putative transposase
VKYSFIAQHKKTWPIDLMCRVLGVKRNGFYSHQKRQATKPVDPLYGAKLACVKEADVVSDSTYGERRIQKALNAAGYAVTRGEAKKLMKAAEVKVRHRKKFKVTTDSDHQQPVFDNVLDRGFTVDEADRAYVSDITYIWTQEGWLYLAVVIDLFSRKVVGWSMGTRMKAQLVCDALEMAIWQRRPKAGLIVHSDRGSQYASKIYRRLLKKHGFIGSMSRKGNCWDNAVAESFFGSLKQERVQWRHYQTRPAAQQDVLSYIAMFYNSKRLHSHLGYKSPAQYEREMSELRKVA